MELKIIVESKNFDHDQDLLKEISKNPCHLCFLGKGPMCADRSFCRWESHKEIYVKKVVVLNEIK